MKKIIIVLLLSSIHAWGQNQNSVRTMHDYLQTILKGLEEGDKPNIDIVRYDTGILSVDDGVLFDYVERKLFKGNVYVLGAFVDKRLSNIAIILQAKNSKGEWEKIKSEDKNTSKSANIGDFETMAFKPEKDDIYRILIGGKSDGEKTARYGIFVGLANVTSDESSNTSSTPAKTPAGKTVYSVDTREDCNWDGKKFVDCSTKEDKSLFEMNAAETVFVHTTSTMKTSYYVREKEYDSAKKQSTYQMRSDSGNEYTFIVNPDNKSISVVGKDKDKVFGVFFRVKTQWTE